MERVIDTVFGKRLGNSNYHINTEYNNRAKIDDAESTILDHMSSEVDKIMTSINLDDEVKNILGKLKDKLAQKDIIGINKMIAYLSFLKYELWFIIRTDLEESSELSNINRVYAMNKSVTDISLPKINHLESGITNVFDTDLDINMNSMVMSFIEDGKIKVEEADLIGLTPILDDYQALSNTKETALMDTANVLHMLEQDGFKFIISMNQSPVADELEA
jgi:hypothetical protein